MSGGRRHLSPQRDRSLASASAPGLEEPPGPDRIPAWSASRAGLLVLAFRAAAAGVGVVVTALLGRALGPRGFGELSVIFAVAVIAGGLTDFGATPIAVADMAGDPARRGEVAAGLAGLRFAGGVALALLGGAFVLAIGHRGQSPGAVVAILATVPLAGVFSLVALPSARLRPQVGASIGLLQSGLWLVAVAVLAAAHAPLVAFGLAFLGCGAFQAGAAWWAVRREPVAWSRWRPEAARLARRAWPLGAAAALTTLYYRVDALFVYRFSGAAEAGFYAAAYRFLDVLQLLPAALVAVVLPVLASVRRADEARARRVVSLAVGVAAAAGAGVAFGGLVVGRPVVAAVYGSGFARAGTILPILGLAFFSIATGYVYANALIARGDERVLGAVAAVAAVASIVADALVVPRWGGVGAAWVTVATEYAVSTSLALRLHRRGALVFPWSRVGRSVLAGAVMAALAWPLRGWPAAALVPAFAVAYLGLVVLLGGVTRADLRALTDRDHGLGEVDSNAVEASLDASTALISGGRG